MLIGYMRVSSNDERQSVSLQRDALIAAGVDPRHLGVWGVVELKRRLSGSIEWSITGKSIC